ncbi:MAG: hypothetical protein JWP57_3993, partial [Spirosoma sp.]|nr:hypothetical protein [Spirosoma sp.]
YGTTGAYDDAPLAAHGEPANHSLAGAFDGAPLAHEAESSARPKAIAQSYLAIKLIKGSTQGPVDCPATQETRMGQKADTPECVSTSRGILHTGLDVRKIYHLNRPFGS